MRPLRYCINVTLDGCCDHRAIPVDEDLHRHAVQNLNQADALLFRPGTDYDAQWLGWPQGARCFCRAPRGHIRWQTLNGSQANEPVIEYGAAGADARCSPPPARLPILDLIVGTGTCSRWHW